MIQVYLIFINRYQLKNCLLFYQHYMDFQYSPQINQEVFRLFSNALSNQDIRRSFPHLTIESLQSIIEVSVELVIGQIENLYTTKFSFQQDNEYDKRREQVIRQISSNRRLIFSGTNANKLGQNSLNHLFRICKYYMRYGNLNNYNYKIIHKLFKSWLDPSKGISVANIESGQSELAKKKRHMQKLKIEHDILIKKSQIISIQEEIQVLEQTLRAKDKQCKVQEEQEDMHYPMQHTPLQVTSSNPSMKQRQSDTLIKQESKAPAEASHKEGSKREQKGIKWKQQEEEFLVQLLQKYTIRDQANLLSQMQQRFGEQKFTPYTLRDKKYQMLRITREKCLLAIRNKQFFNQQQFKAFANHFMTIDNIQAYKFITKFLHRYYFCNFQSLSIFAFKEVISEVFQQETRVLSRVHTSKIINQLIANHSFRKNAKTKNQQQRNSMQISSFSSKKLRKSKSQLKDQ